MAQNTAMLQAAEDATQQKAKVVATGGPVDREASGFGGGEGISPPVFELSTSDNQVIGTFAFGYTKARSSFSAPDEKGQQQISAGIAKFGLEASVPFNGSEETDVLDFRNIGNKGELTLTATWYATRYTTSSADQLNINRAYRQCVVAAVADTEGDQAAQAQAFLSLLNNWFADPSNNFKTARGYINQQLPSHPKVQALINSACIEGHGDDYIFGQYGEAALGRDAYLQAQRSRLGGSLKFIGGQFSAGYGTYNIINRTRFALDQEKRVGFDGRVYAGLISNDGRRSGRLSLGYARGYEAQDSVEFCRPDPSGSGQSCISGEDGRPLRSENSYVSVEGRFGFGNTRVGPPQFGIAPQITYRIEDSDFLFDLPVYVVRQSDTGLSGGVRAAYDTGKDDFTMRVFVGLPFSTWF